MAARPNRTPIYPSLSALEAMGDIDAIYRSIENFHVTIDIIVSINWLTCKFQSLPLERTG